MDEPLKSVEKKTVTTTTTTWELNDVQLINLLRNHFVGTACKARVDVDFDVRQDMLMGVTVTKTVTDEVLS